MESKIYFVLLYFKNNSVYHVSMDLSNPLYSSFLDGSEPNKLYQFPAGKFAPSIDTPDKDVLFCSGAAFRGCDLSHFLINPHTLE